MTQEIIGPADESQLLGCQDGLTAERRESLLAYCKLTELSDDPEVAALIPALYSAAVGYLANAGVNVPESGTARRAQYDLCVNYLVLDAYERRDVTGTAVSDNPVFRRLINQLKLTEPQEGEVYGETGAGR